MAKTSPSAAGRRNFRLSSLEILVTVLIFVGVLYLLTLWSTNLFSPSEGTTAPAAPPSALVERALAASEKVLAEQNSLGRALGSLRKQVEVLQAQARKTHGAGSNDPVDAAQDQRLDEVNRRLDELGKGHGRVLDLGPLLARLDKLEKDLGSRPVASAHPAAALMQQEGRLQRLEAGLQEAREGLGHARVSQTDPAVCERLARLEKALSQCSPAPAAEAPTATAVIPAPSTPRSEAHPPARPAAKLDGESKRVSHKVRDGETLGGLTQRYKVSAEDIMKWNSMGSRRLLLKGESLTIYLGPNS